MSIRALRGCVVKAAGVIGLGVFLCLLGAGNASAEVSSSGSYQTDIPVEVPSFHGIEPRLDLTYDSSAGNGLLGVGWRLNGLSEIQRASVGRGAPHYDDSDIFFLDGMELVRCSPAITSPSCTHPVASPGFIAYAFRTETYRRVAYEMGSNGGRWHVWDKNGTRSIYTAVKPPSYGPFRWKLQSVEDTSGNQVQYTYLPLDANPKFADEEYPDKISYNGTLIKLYYQRRSDITSFGTGRIPIAQRRLLKTIDITVNGNRARAYSLRYDQVLPSLKGAHSHLVDVTQYGTTSAVDSAGNVSGPSLPPVHVVYSGLTGTSLWNGDVANAGQQLSGGPAPASIYPDTPVANVRVSSGLYGPTTTGDFNGDGRTDWLSAGFAKLSTGPTDPTDITVTTTITGPHAPATLRTTLTFIPDSAWVGWDRLTLYAWSADLNGDGRSDVLFGIGYEPSADPVDEQVALAPALSKGDGSFVLGPAVRTNIIHHNFDPAPPQCRAGDFDGNGITDVACGYMPRVNQMVGQTESFLTTALFNSDGSMTVSDAKLPFHDAGGLRSMAAADSNRDGRTDLFFVDYNFADLDEIVAGNKVPIHYELATGLSTGGDAATFNFTRTPTPWTYVPNSNPPVVSASDINGDGQPDYLILQQGAGNMQPVSILTGRTQPSGPLLLNEQTIPSALSSGEHFITIGDTNGDGMEDLLVAAQRAPGGGTGCAATTFADAVLTRVLSKGDGTFSLPTAWDDCSTAKQIAVEWNQSLRSQELNAADTNGDGLADFLIAANSPNPKEVLLHDDVSASTGLDAFRWMPAELNGDGRRDYVYVQPQGGQTMVHTLISQQSGGYVQGSAHIAPDLFGIGRQVARGWKVMDANGDGRSDLVYVHCSGKTVSSDCLVEVEVLFSRGNGQWDQSFPQVFTWTGAREDAVQLVPADVNGDGKTDLVSFLNDINVPGSGSVTVTSLIATGSQASPFSQVTPQGPFGMLGNDTANLRPLDIDGNGRTDFVRLSSSGGSLSLTALMQQGSGWLEKPFTMPQSPAEGWDGISPSDTANWRAVELNGDGQADLVHVVAIANGVRIHTLLSSGSGSHWVPNWKDLPLAGGAIEDNVSWISVDRDRDGRTDLVHVGNSPTGLSVTTLEPTGDGLMSAGAVPVTDPGTAGNRSSPTWHGTDLDADGRGDLARVDLTSPPSGPRQLEVSFLLSGSATEALVSVTGSTGGTTTVAYGSSSQFQPNQPAFGCFLPEGTSLRVVTSTTIDDGRKGVETTKYGLGCPHWSYYHRTFLGYEEVNASTAATANRPAATLAKRFSQTDECLARLTSVGYLDAFGHYVGTRDAIAYLPPGGTPAYQCLVLYRDRITAGLSDQTQNVYTYFNYDEFGNAINVFDHGAELKTGDERTATRTFAYATDPWIVGVPRQESLSDPSTPLVGLLRSTYFCYDGSNGTDWTNCTAPPTKGLLTQVQRVDDLGFNVNTEYQYDSRGNLAVSQNPRHLGTVTFFDPTFHTYPTGAVNTLGQSSSQDWDTTLGKLKKSTDANGAVSQTGYDDFGRTKVSSSSDGPTVHREYVDWGDPQKQHIHEYADDGSADGLWIDTYLDGLGRAYKTVKEGDLPGSSFTQETAYSDSSDRPLTRSNWFRSGTTPTAVESFDYDETGRVLSQTHSDKTYVQLRYTADTSTTSTISTNERGIRKTSVFDAYGSLQSVTERDAATAQTATSTYSHDGVGQLVTTTDPNGNVTTNTWDRLGRLTSVEDPNLGKRSTTYDLAGNISTRTDARNRVTKFTYDALDRMKTKTYPNNAVITWNYDQPGHGASKGRLTSVSDLHSAGCAGGVTDDFTYDLQGRPTSSSKCIDGMTKVTGFGYDAMGRPKSITYPDTEVVTYDYDAAGRPSGMPGYVDKMTYDAEGQPEEVQYSNGTTATFTYNPDRSWLETTSVKDGVGSDVYDATYTYEPNGLVKTSSSTTNAMNLKFDYDDLGRLLSSSGDVNQSFRYDRAGEMTYNSAIGTYAYPPQGPSGCPSGGVPHPCKSPSAATSVGVGSNYLGFHFDDNGNLSSTTNNAGQNRGIDWTYDDQPEVLSDFGGTVTTYAYGADGDRVSRQRNSEYTRYFNTYVEQSNMTGLTKTYRIGSLVVARNQLGSTQWLHQDGLGSTRAVTDKASNVVQRYDYTPFGEETSSSTLRNPLRFAGGDTDSDNDLVYLEARYYDPHVGRFISPDTVLPDALNTQALNPYSYGYNSPVSYTDPSGHDPDGINQTLNSGPYGVSITATPEPPPYQRPPGQICSACHGGTRIYDTPPFANMERPTDIPPADDYSSIGIRLNGLDHPRPSYDSAMADFYAHRRSITGDTYIKWAELAESHPCAACHITHGLGHIPTDSELDYNRYLKASLWTAAARHLIETVVIVGDHLARTAPPDPVHSRYADGKPVFEGQQPGKITGPDVNANGNPHTVLQWDKVNGRIYKAREYGAGNVPVRDIDFTGPTFPTGRLRPNHNVPEQHPWTPVDPANPKAGFKRTPTGVPLVYPPPYP